MSKYLILLRHAETEPLQNLMDDFNRQITRHGIDQAAEAALKIRTMITEPAFIISSPAVRTQSTALIVASALNFPIEHIRFSTLLYEAEPEDFLHVINLFNKEFQTAIIVAHNPGISQTAAYLSDGSSVNLFPAGIIRIHFGENNWDSISRHSGTIVP